MIAVLWTAILIVLCIWKFVDDAKHSIRKNMHGEESNTPSSRIMLGFIGKTQVPLFMIWREYWEHHEVVYAEVIWTSSSIEKKIEDKAMKLLGYRFVENPKYARCCRYWTNCKHPPIWWHEKKHKMVRSVHHG